jgi:23S rRNA (guanosine2251-2'-O)-methyltransferase
MTTLLAGRKPVLEALKAGTAIQRIILLANVHGAPIDQIKTLAGKLGVEVQELDKQQFRTLASDTTTQGVLAIVAPRSYATLDDVLAVSERRGERGFLLVLDGIEDPHNLGALIRTAECAGVHGVVIPKHHAASVTPAVVKASAGATEHTPVAEVTNIAQTIATLKQAGYWVVGLDESGEKDFKSVDYTTATALVVGSEGKGMRRLVRESCDHVVRIPLRGRIGSLNASVAGALVMYEVVRQRIKS